MIDLHSIPSFCGPVRSEIDDHYDAAVRHFHEGGFVELGAFFGRSAIYLGLRIRDRGSKIKVYAVDTFRPRENDECGDLYRKAFDDHGGSSYEAFLESVRLAGVRDIVIPIRDLSWQAAGSFRDQSLSMVFVDAGHAYPDCSQDIEAYWPKLKSGGWMSGHDFNWRFPGVVEAAQQFAEKHLLDIVSKNSVWKIVKP